MIPMANAILWISVFAGLALGAMAFIQGGLSRRSVWFAVTMLFSALWSLGIIISFANPAEWHDTYGGLVNVPPVMLFFAISQMMLAYVNIPEWVRKLSLALAGVAAILLSGMMIFADGFLLVHASGEGDTFHMSYNPITMGIIGVQLALLVVLTLIIMIRAMKEARTPMGKKLIRNVMIGYLCGFVAGGVFNVAMSSNHWIHWVGPAATLIYAVTMYRAVIKFGADEV